MSTSTSYLLLSRDMSRTMSNIARDRTVASDARYYQANIGKVKTVDDLMGDFKLYTYVMKAYGLEDMAYARSFIKKVLTSDMGDANSFANKLTDKRYQDFANAFKFGTDGKVTAVTDIQSDLQENELTGLYARTIIGRQQAVESDVAYYDTAIDAVTSVDAFLNDARLFSFAMTAHGLGDRVQYASKTFYRSLLTSDLSDPGPANPLNAITDTALRDKLSAFAAAFGFASDGTVAAGAAQTPAAKGATIDGYLAATGQTNASFNILRTVEAYRSGIAAVTDVDDLIADSKLYNFMLTAYGLDPAKVDSADVRAALLSDPDDPAGAASTLGLAYQRMARDFDFASDGSLPPGEPAQTAAATSATVTRYLANANGARQGDLAEFIAYGAMINDTAIIADVDDMLGSSTLYNIVLRTFGFDPAIASRDNIRAALVSDLDDPLSFANQSTNPSYRRMAEMFNFATDGSIAGGGPLQSADAIEEMQLRYMAKGFGAIAVTTQATSAYRIDMRSVDNVDEFLADKASFSFALVAFGFAIDFPSTSFFRQVLVSDLNDPSSFANQQSDPRYRDFAAAFAFAADGSLPSGRAQTQLAEDAMVERFLKSTSRTSGAYRLQVADDYAANINAIRTVSAFLSDDNATLYDVALRAYGIDPAKTSKAEIERVLTSDLSSASSAARTLGGGFLQLAQAFNFGRAGVVPNGVDTQSQAQISATVAGYLASTTQARDAEITSATSTFKSGMKLLETLAKSAGVLPIDEFLRNTALYDYALRAYGLDPKEESKFDIRRALLANPADVTSFVNAPGNEKYRALAAAMNFDPDGTVGTPRMAQELESAKRVATKYAGSFPTASAATADAQKAAIAAETDYYATAILKVTNVDQLTSDPRMVAYIRKAFGFEPNALPVSTLKSILLSDLADTKSYANAAKDTRYREIAAAFNFDTKGAAKRLPEIAAQDGAAIYATYESYLQQKLEVDAGADDPGVRLALYFKRKAASLTGAFSVMADKALYEVVRTALQIPDAAIRADINVLARTIEKRINFADFKDPAKVDKFIRQFTAFYDIKNQGGADSSRAIGLSLISGSVDTSFSTDLLNGLQRVRASRF